VGPRLPQLQIGVFTDTALVQLVHPAGVLPHVAQVAHSPDADHQRFDGANHDLVAELLQFLYRENRRHPAAKHIDEQRMLHPCRDLLHFGTRFGRFDEGDVRAHCRNIDCLDRCRLPDRSSSARRSGCIPLLAQKDYFQAQRTLTKEADQLYQPYCRSKEWISMENIASTIYGKSAFTFGVVASSFPP
jgi:hypothetical protein